MTRRLINWHLDHSNAVAWVAVFLFAFTAAWATGSIWKGLALMFTAGMWAYAQSVESMVNLTKRFEE